MYFLPNPPSNAAANGRVTQFRSPPPQPYNSTTGLAVLNNSHQVLPSFRTTQTTQTNQPGPSYQINPTFGSTVNFTPVTSGQSPTESINTGIKRQHEEISDDDNFSPAGNSWLADYADFADDNLSTTVNVSADCPISLSFRDAVTLGINIGVAHCYQAMLRDIPRAMQSINQQYVAQEAIQHYFAEDRKENNREVENPAPLN